MKKTKIQSFTDLHVWQKGHDFVLFIYKISQLFPKSELFGLTSQIRRAAVSFTSNIAEGFGRNSFSEKAHFYSIAHGSLIESQNQLLIARDLKYISAKIFQDGAEQTITLSKMINGLIKTSKTKSH